MNITELKDRTALGPWLNENGLTGSMVEIGVAFGGYASQVLSSWIGHTYWLVDPWAEQSKDVYKEKTDGIPYEHWYKQCVDLANRDGRVKIMREYSERAARDFPDGHFDCVYIDGNHCREAFEADLAAWWPKVKSGGLLGAHDHYNAFTDGHHCEVETVVREWENRTGLKGVVTPCTSWWIIKP